MELAKELDGEISYTEQNAEEQIYLSIQVIKTTYHSHCCRCPSPAMVLYKDAPELHPMDRYKRNKPSKSEQGDELQEYLPQVFDNSDHSSPLPGSIVTL